MELTDQEWESILRKKEERETHWKKLRNQHNYKK